MRKSGLMEGTSVFLFDEFLHPANKTSGDANDTKRHFMEKMGPSHHITRKCFFFNSSYLNKQKVPTCGQKDEESFFFFFKIFTIGSDL